MSWLQHMRATWRPAHPAIVTPTQSVSYADLDERIRRAAGWLDSLELGPGHVLALQMPRELAFVEVHLAALGMGIVTLPLNATYPASELDYYLADSGASVAIVLDDNLTSLTVDGVRVFSAGAVRHLIDAAPELPVEAILPDDAPAMILYTSGTTGRAKGAALSHGNLRATVEGLHQAWRWQPDDVLVHALPLFHVHGLFVAQHGALRAGATTRWLGRFEAREALDTLQDHGGTLFMGVPTFYNRILALPENERWDLEHVRLFTSGSAPLPARDHRAFEQRFGHRILERYGMTEVGIVLTNPYEGERRPGAVGFPVPGAEVQVFREDDTLCDPNEVGEVRISGPSVFGGYLGRPQATAQALVDGWMRSGDLGFVDPDGYIHLVGRSRDMILSGGLNVYPIEVESALLAHPEVSAAAVVGVADPDLGERVVASIVTRDASPLAHSEILAFARERLAPYKLPKAVETLPALPRNAMGKVDKAALRRRWAELHVRPATPDDVDTLVRWNVAMALETEDLALDPDIVREGVRSVFERDVGARYFVVWSAGQRLGGCMVTDEWSDWRARSVWWFQSVYIERAWRRRGVFRCLYAGIERSARAAGAAGLRLYVDRRNRGAEATYRALGMDDAHYAMFEAMFDESSAT